MTPAKTVIKNFGWATASKLFNLLVTVVVGIYIARYLGPEKYGLLNYTLSYVGLFSVLASFGMQQILVKEFAQNVRNNASLLFNSIRLRLAFAFLAIILITVTVILTEQNTTLRLYIITYSTVLLAQAFEVYKSLFTAQLKEEISAKAELTKAILSLCIKLTLILTQADLYAFILANLADFFILAIGYRFMLKLHKYNNVSKLDFVLMKRILRQSFPIMLSGAAIVIYERVDQVMLKNMVGAEALGQYAAAQRFSILALLLPQVFSNVMFPILSRLAENKEVFKQKVQLFTDAMLWSSIAIAAILTLLSHIMVPLLMGESYLIASDILKILVWKNCIWALGLISGQWLIIKNLQRYSPWQNSMGALLNVGLNFWFIPIFGVMGAVYATLMSFGTTVLIFPLFFKSFRPFVGFYLRSIALGPANLFKNASALRESWKS